MIKWSPFELHTHSVHSDALHNLDELAYNAKIRDLDGFALTDHNTVSGWFECSSIEKNAGICILKGMECTTFHGHMVFLGLSEYEDWRQFTPANINTKIKDIKDKGGIVGIAHPFQLGSPICTGGYWEYEVSDWSKISYMEVWHGQSPYSKEYNKRSFDLWTSLLNMGYKVAGTYGRDWHHTDSGEQFFAVTCLGIDEGSLEDVEKGALDAIANGRMIITLGPILELYVESITTGEKTYIGREYTIDTALDTIKISIAIYFTGKRYECKLVPQHLQINITSNLGTLETLEILMINNEKSFSIVSKGLKWVRAELYGDIGDIKEEKALIAFTNPIYINTKQVCI